MLRDQSQVYYNILMIYLCDLLPVRPMSVENGQYYR